MTHKALPDNIDKFFEGSSVFFGSEPAQASSPPPFPNKTTSQTTPNTERVNGRTVEGTNASTERGYKRPNTTSAHTNHRSVSPSIAQDNTQTTRKKEISESTSFPVPTEVESDREESKDSILARLQQGRTDNIERTERYSFEIYPEQKEEIEDFLYQYRKRTGEKLSASKLIREALTTYFQLLNQHGKDR